VKRKKRTFRASDEEYQQIREYAQCKGRTISDFVRYSALSEISKHPPKNGLKSMVLQIIREELQNGFPTLGNEAGAVLSGDQG